ncbi:uncharacterized protein LOC110068055 isoform X1 [Orbicella faveolata]|uniref:uncharacterized protein LOC110068055 isoform X1 n=2 Tax=Orbicella faveolata TaxID=48498 RepID=UPI0009E33109|nr:uncharacterized protein LOC110068055 isoform X1 [Orbicella faveolata]
MSETQLSSSMKEKDQNGGEEQEVVEEEPIAGEEDDGFDDTQATAEKEGRKNAEKTGGRNRNTHELDKRSKESSKPASSRTSTHLDKKSQHMLAELRRLKRQMTEFQRSIDRPPQKEFTPDIFNSLSPYYNRYMVNSTIQDLQQQEEVECYRGYGHRPTALGVVDPEVSWKLDNFPNPVPQSRLPGRLFLSAEWSRNLSRSSDKEGSTRLPPLPMPSFPKFNQSHYQPHRMTYDQVANFRSDLNDTYEVLAEKQAKADYERTLQDWNRMNLSELKKLPPNPRYHIKKAIVSYLGTSRGSSRALKPLTKELNATTPTPISQP